MPIDSRQSSETGAANPFTTQPPNQTQNSGSVELTSDAGTTSVTQEANGNIWLWLTLGGLALLAALGFLYYWKRKEAAKPRLIEHHPLPKDGTGTEKGAVQERDTHSGRSTAKPALQIEAQALSLGRSFANATLSYAITLTNQSDMQLQNLSIEADMTSAHGAVPIQEQVTERGTALPPVATIDRLPAGSAKQARGEFRLPLGELRLIRQGSAHLYVPLLRLKVSAEGIEPVTRTFVVGVRQPGRSTRLLPFRLDEMAQTYRNIAVRELA